MDVTAAASTCLLHQWSEMVCARRACKLWSVFWDAEMHTCSMRGQVAGQHLVRAGTASIYQGRWRVSIWSGQGQRVFGQGRRNDVPSTCLVRALPLCGVADACCFSRLAVQKPATAMAT
eukprot:355127-Chlamydomonas_euryale.AAC.15